MNTTILTENHPQSSGGHRTESSLNMPPKSWKDYVPRYVSLYYVDYNENLDNHEDLQERCIRRNSLHPLEEQVWEWYAEQEHDNLQGYLADIRKAMEADGKADEYARNEEGIKDLSFWPMPHTEASSASISMPYSPDCSREIPEMISSASGSTEMSSLPLRTAATVQDTMSGCQRTSPSRFAGTTSLRTPKCIIPMPMKSAGC